MPLHRNAVQLHAGDVRPLRMIGLDGQGLPVRKGNNGLAEKRRRHQVLARAGTRRIQADGSEYVPRPHLAAVLVAAEAIGRDGIGFLQDLADKPLRPGRSACPAEQPREVVVGLIALRILADDTSDASVQGLLIVGHIGKQGIQGIPKRFLPAHERGQARDVVRDEEAVLPGRCLRVVAGAGKRVEGRGPGPVRVLAPHESGRRVEDLPVAERAAVVFRGEIGLTQGFGHPGDAPVIVGEFQRLRDGLDLPVGGNPAVLKIELGSIDIGLVGRSHHRREGPLAVKAADASEPGVGDDRDAVVADHAAGLVAGEGPDREFPAAVVVVQHAADHVIDEVRVQQGFQRVPGPERVPERERGIEVAAFRQLAVPARLVPVTPVEVVDAVGRDEGVVEARVEHVRRATFDPDPVESVRPDDSGPLPEVVEPGAGRFLHPVRPGTICIHAGNADVQLHLFQVIGKGELHHTGFRFVHRQERF